MNVGASKASEAGLYFQWGDTIGYTAEQVGKDKQFNWDNCKWYPERTFTKYDTNGAALELEDDAVHVNMGGDWHMPAPDQIQELIDNTTTAWTTSNGTGMTFTSTANGKSIFIPASGYASDGSVYANGSWGYVWSSMLNKISIYSGMCLLLSDVSLGSYTRCYGLPMRGVIG